MTMGGKIPLRLRGSAMVSPSRMLALAFRIAVSIVLFPEALETIFNPSKIGTPLLTSVPRVRENRAIAIFLNFFALEGQHWGGGWRQLFY
jgi:hypothetical protein